MNDHVNDNGYREQPRREPTIGDVAREAGVSRQTVSRAINDKPEISPDTRRRILDIARRLGYRPNSIARSLKTRRSHTIGLIVPDIANPFFAQVVRGASETAYGAGYSVLLCNTDEHPGREEVILRTLRAHRVEGLVLISSRLEASALEQVLDTSRPLVLVNRMLSPRAGVGCVCSNDADGAICAVRHLYERGHRRIGFLAGRPESRSSRERLRGYRRAMQDVGVPNPESWCLPCAPTVEGGREGARRLLTARPELTALLCYNDLVAVGAEQACRAMDYAIPGRCALVGFDDIEFAAHVSPPLTTMSSQKFEIGQRAMALLQDLIETPELAPEPLSLDAELVVRASS